MPLESNSARYKAPENNSAFIGQACLLQSDADDAMMSLRYLRSRGGLPCIHQYLLL